MHCQNVKNNSLTVVHKPFITEEILNLGSTCGLCGNFNDDQNDDFTTPELDVVVNAASFGDSWKVNDRCPDTKPSVHPCSIHKARAPWSHKQCNVINREVFKPCHAVVNPHPYFDACYHDACGCDMGGDCECLCTAVSAYAEACNAQGVYIKWRSQQLCREYLLMEHLYLYAESLQ